MAATVFSLTVDKMHCDGCVQRVRAALSRIDGVDETSVAIGAVTGVADDDAAVDDAISAITAAGYPASRGSGPAPTSEVVGIGKRRG
ncbi:MAG TPA: heavy-metal-associated domain-containing protein [Myxococcota bacterium]|jgi:copper chaperone CopZ